MVAVFAFLTDVNFCILCRFFKKQVQAQCRVEPGRCKNAESFDHAKIFRGNDFHAQCTVNWWTNIVSKSKDCKIVKIEQMQSDKEVWDDWLAQENEYAKNDRKSMNAGAGKYLNFISIILQKK